MQLDCLGPIGPICLKSDYSKFSHFHLNCQAKNPIQAAKYIGYIVVIVNKKAKKKKYP